MKCNCNKEELTDYYRILYDNEEIYYNVDKIHNAITENKMV
jgi:hypothetical protein